jgi:hypothetical protein
MYLYEGDETLRHLAMGIPIEQMETPPEEVEEIEDDEDDEDLDDEDKDEDDDE